MRAQGQAEAVPGVEVVGDGDRAAGALALPDAPVLVERRGADDGGLVDPLGAVDVVGAAVGGHRAEPGGAACWGCSCRSSRRCSTRSAGWWSSRTATGSRCRWG